MWQAITHQIKEVRNARTQPHHRPDPLRRWCARGLSGGGIGRHRRFAAIGRRQPVPGHCRHLGRGHQRRDPGQRCPALWRNHPPPHRFLGRFPQPPGIAQRLARGDPPGQPLRRPQPARPGRAGAGGTARQLTLAPAARQPPGPRRHRRSPQSATPARRRGHRIRLRIRASGDVLSGRRRH
ncbi:hypothetical protein D3C86_1540330 [compost metagenome]